MSKKIFTKIIMLFLWQSITNASCVCIDNVLRCDANVPTWIKDNCKCDSEELKCRSSIEDVETFLKKIEEEKTIVFVSEPSPSVVYHTGTVGGENWNILNGTFGMNYFPIPKQTEGGTNESRNNPFIWQNLKNKYVIEEKKVFNQETLDLDFQKYQKEFFKGINEKRLNEYQIRGFGDR